MSNLSRRVTVDWRIEWIISPFSFDSSEVLLKRNIDKYYNRLKEITNDAMKEKRMDRRLGDASNLGVRHNT